MGNSETKPDIPTTPEEVKEKKPCPACSACKETRKVRDACIFKKGEEHCAEEIEAHKQCLRDHGMKI